MNATDSYLISAWHVRNKKIKSAQLSVKNQTRARVTIVPKRMRTNSVRKFGRKNSLEKEKSSFNTRITNRENTSPLNREEPMKTWSSINVCSSRKVTKCNIT